MAVRVLIHYGCGQELLDLLAAKIGRPGGNTSRVQLQQQPIEGVRVIGPDVQKGIEQGVLNEL